MVEHTSQNSKPKRPLSAYNLFFKNERTKILSLAPVRSDGKPRRSHGKIGFASLARSVADKWKSIDPETYNYYKELAMEEKARYKQEKAEWKKTCIAQKRKRAGSSNHKQTTHTMKQDDFTDDIPDVFSVEDLCSIPPTSTNHGYPAVVSFDDVMSNYSFSDSDTENEEQGSNRLPDQYFVIGTDYSEFLKPIGVIGTTNRQKEILLDVSELATKLDNDCIDLLSGFLENGTI